MCTGSGTVRTVPGRGAMAHDELPPVDDG